MGLVEIKGKLKKFKKKYFLNLLIRNTIVFLSIVLIISLLSLLLDYILQPGITGRTIIFYSGLVLIIFNFAWLLLPWILGYFNYGAKSLSNEQAALLIGNHFPTVGDKLLNALQLQKISHQDSDLILAGIDQKINEFRTVSFSEAINLRINFRYLKYLGGVILAIVISGVSTPSLLKDSSTRLINHTREFERPLPFQFSILNKELQAFKGEDFTLKAKLSGDFIPQDLFVNIDERLVKMRKSADGLFIHTFSTLQRSIDFNLYAAGYESSDYTLSVFPLPEMKNFEVFVDYPAYTGLKDYQVSNIGNFTLPEGSRLRWLIKSSNSEKTEILLLRDSTTIVSNKDKNEELKHTFRESSVYEIQLENQFGSNKEKIQYEVEVTKDEYPTINAEIFVDTVLFEFVVLSGNISDDYGISSLKIVSSKNNSVQSVFPVEVNPNAKSQSFYQRLSVDSLGQGENIQLYVSVRDNDGVNGAKESRSQVFRIKKPDRSDIYKSLAKKASDTEEDLDESIEEATSLNEKLKELEDRLKTKPEIEWQEEKLINDILKQREEIEKNLEELKQKYEELRLAENKFNDRSKRIQEKSENLQKLMNEVMDEETKKLYDELKKLMEEAEDAERIQQQLSKITPNEKNLEKELERALELFKRLKLESKLEKTAKELEELGEKQEKLAEENLGNKKDTERSDSEERESGEKKQEQQSEESSGEDKRSALDKQKEVEDEFERLKKEIKEAQELNQELKQPEPLENTNEDQQSIEQNLDEIKKQLEQNQRKKAGQNQRQSGNQMKKLGQKMQNMQMSMEMEMMRENVDQLRQILDNLIKLSFEQEEIMDNFREVSQVDPRYIELSQEQLKLKDDAKVIEDSLLSLASRVAQISTFVTREVSEVNRNIDNALEDLRDRNRSKALSDQQFAMTSINNLALLLDDILQQMQMALSEAMGNPQQSQQGNKQLPNLKELQQQLSDQISEIKKSGLKGRELSEELARMAAEQEMIRNELKKIQEQIDGQMKGGEELGGNLGELQKLMEENEVDLVNKELTRELIERQQEIMTRMLEAEEAMREQEFDPERKGEQANQYDRPLPPAYEKYLKEKQKEIELLKSLPLEFNPFYKKEVNDYFRRLTSDN